MEIDLERRSAHDEESGRSDDDSSAEDARDNDDNMEEEQEESGLARSAKELISKLENNEWEVSHLTLESEILSHLLPHVERFRQALQGNTVITAVCIDVGCVIHAQVELSPEDFAILGQVFANHPLQKVTLRTRASHTGFENLSNAAAFLRQTRQIQRFSLEVQFRQNMGTEHGFDSRGYADVLRHLPALDYIELHALSPEESRHITFVLPSLSNLKSVRVDSHDITSDDEGLQQVLRVETLQKLRLSECVLSERNVLTIGEHLSSSGSCLADLELYKCQLPRKGCESLSASLKHSRTLRHLDLSSHIPADTFFDTLKDSLSANTSLEFLTLTGDLSKKAAVDLVEAIRGNYSLLNVESIPDSPASCLDVNQESMLRCLPRLNVAGRRYMLEDPTSEKGFDVLWCVKEDLDCLFLHLQENQWLCTEVMRRAAADEERKREASGQEEPPASKKLRSECIIGSARILVA